MSRLEIRLEKIDPRKVIELGEFLDKLPPSNEETEEEKKLVKMAIAYSYTNGLLLTIPKIGEEANMKLKEEDSPEQPKPEEPSEEKPSEEPKEEEVPEESDNKNENGDDMAKEKENESSKKFEEMGETIKSLTEKIEELEGKLSQSEPKGDTTTEKETGPVVIEAKSMNDREWITSPLAAKEGAMVVRRGSDGKVTEAFPVKPLY